MDTILQQCIWRLCYVSIIGCKCGYLVKCLNLIMQIICSNYKWHYLSNRVVTLYIWLILTFSQYCCNWDTKTMNICYNVMVSSLRIYWRSLIFVQWLFESWSLCGARSGDPGSIPGGDGKELKNSWTPTSASESTISPWTILDHCLWRSGS